MTKPAIDSARIDELLANPQRLAESICNAIENDARRAQERMAAVDAQPCGDKVFIRLDAKRGRQRVHAWVTSVSYTGDPGYKISKVFYSDVYVKAKQFTGEAGRAIARQMAGNFNMLGVTLEDK